MNCDSVLSGPDFSKCFQERYLKAMIPLIFVGTSLLFALLSYAYDAIRSVYQNLKLRSNSAKLVATEDDDSLDSEEQVFVDEDARDGDDSELTLIDSLPQDTKVSIIEDKPAYERIWTTVEIALLLGQVTLSIFSLVKGKEWRSISVVGYFQWVYLLIIALLRNLGTNKTKRLWTHSMLIYLFSWPVGFIMLRSAILGENGLDLGVQIANLCFITGLCGLVLMVRAGNKPVKLVSTNGLEPFREPTASLLSLATFSWVDPVIIKGWSHTFTIKDVWDLREDDQAPILLKAFRKVKSTMKSIRIAWSLIKYFDTLLIAQGTWSVFYALSTYAPTILLRQILLYVEHPETRSREIAWLCVVGLFLSSVFTSIANGQALWIGRRICLRLRTIIIGEVYAKALRRRDVAAKGGDSLDDKAPTAEKKEKVTATQANNGAIINLMAVDAFKVSEISAYLHYLLVGVPIELVIAIGLLYNLLGASAFVGLLAVILVLPAQYLINRRYDVVQEKLMSATDKRVTRLNEVLQSIRIIKFFAWEDKFNAIVNEARREELRWLQERLYLWAGYGIIWFGFPIIITLATFTSYTQWFGHDLTASTAFTALSLFTILKHPMDQLTDTITNVIQSKVSLERVDEFLREEETEKYSTALKRRKSSVHRRGNVAKFENATFTWASRTEIAREGNDPVAIAQLAFQLRDISIEFPSDALTLITGPTGSGKTSLLMALLGELSLLKGSVYLPCTTREEILQDPGLGLTDTVAYCAQQAWLLNDTIKNNILFAAPFNKQRYDHVIMATALEKDLEILEAGDETEVGERGITMSGGQKQRISLARALYSSARFILMDDCLSAVDSHTAQWIYRYGIAGELMAGRTRILVTHNVALTLPSAKHVVVLDNGRIKAQGSPEEVLKRKGFGEETSLIQNTISRSGTNTPASSSREASDATLVSLSVRENDADADDLTTEALLARKDSERKKAAGRLVQEEEKASGSVSWRVYKTYLESLGSWWYWVLIIGFFLLQQGTQVFQSYWIRVWAASYGNRVEDVVLQPMMAFAADSQSRIWGYSFDNGFPQMSPANDTMQIYDLGDSISGKDDMFYIIGYSIIGFGYVLVALLRSILIFFGGLRASRILFEKLLDSVTRAKLRFFDTTPIGRIMNRFSKDMETVDQETSWILIAVFTDVLSVITIVVLITVITPGFLIAGIVITAVFALIGMAYLRSSVELKSETLNGVSTIRAYGDEQRFIHENLRKINDNNRPFILLWATNRWLSIRVDTAGALVSFFAGAFILLNTNKLDAGLAGISLTYAVMFTEHILWVVRLYSQNEMNMNSVERIRHYLHVDPEAARRSLPGHEPPKSWPQWGAIKVEHLTLRYALDLPAVIRDVSFDVEPNAKVAVVGRTGAGKSTIATAFFRILEADGGRILIDDIDIASIGLEELRRKLAIIPQDPTLFKGSLRFNLDPYGEHTDVKIYEALRRVHLISSTELSEERYEDVSINQNVFLNLDTEVAEGGGNLSQGQRQLMCLARALLKSPRVILMDEATASVDYATDAKIQTTIRNEFVNSTIITIAHRLRSIIDFDKVLVLDSGEVKEYDHPYLLLQKENSIFKDMVEQSGEQGILFEIARAAWKKTLLVDVE